LRKEEKFMDVFFTTASFAAGLVAGIIVTKAVIMSKENNIVDKEKLLEECFGEHMYVSRFSLIQARDWIKMRQENIDRGAKALVMKITSETLKNLNKNVSISSDMNNYLAIAVVNSISNKMEDSILVKYDQLDEKLEELLERGNGTLVVGG